MSKSTIRNYKIHIEKTKDVLGFSLDFAIVAIHVFFWEYEIFNKYNRNGLKEAPNSKKKEEALLIDIQKAIGDCKGLLDEMLQVAKNLEKLPKNIREG